MDNTSGKSVNEEEKEEEEGEGTLACIQRFIRMRGAIALWRPETRLEIE